MINEAIIKYSIYLNEQISKLIESKYKRDVTLKLGNTTYTKFMEELTRLEKEYPDNSLERVSSKSLFEVKQVLINLKNVYSDKTVEYKNASVNLPVVSSILEYRDKEMQQIKYFVTITTTFTAAIITVLLKFIADKL